MAIKTDNISLSIEEYRELVGQDPTCPLPTKRVLASARPHQPTTGKMNKTEKHYAVFLEEQKRYHNIIWWGYECWKFRLADKTFYTPDFVVVSYEYDEGSDNEFHPIELIEVKGFLRDDAAVKFKVAAAQYPFFKWKMLRLKGGRWETVYEY